MFIVYKWRLVANNSERVVNVYYNSRLLWQTLASPGWTFSWSHDDSLLLGWMGWPVSCLTSFDCGSGSSTVIGSHWTAASCCCCCCCSCSCVCATFFALSVSKSSACGSDCLMKPKHSWKERHIRWRKRASVHRHAKCHYNTANSRWRK